MSENNHQAVLRFDRVTVRFEDVEALTDLSFEAFEGESRVILGAAGSGKTVLLKTALGLVRPDSGEVYVFGENVAAMSERQLFDIRSKIGMLFQESALFDSLTIGENVAYPLLNQKSIHGKRNRVLRMHRTLTARKIHKKRQAGAHRCFVGWKNWARRNSRCNLCFRGVD